MKKKVKSFLATVAVMLFIPSAIVLCGVLTTDEFEWWFIPIGIVAGVYMIGFLAVTIRNVFKGIW